jgi:hypothetical protein
MTADQAPADSPGTVVFSTVPPRAHVSPFWEAHPRRTVWVPSRNVVTAVPDTVTPSATRSTSVVAGAPSIWYFTVPPRPPLELGEAADVEAEAAAGVDAAGEALPVAPAQPATRTAMRKTPRIVRMLIPPPTC